jgi:hypothetical protein
MFFYFVPIIFMNHMFKVYLNRFIEIHENVKFHKSTCKQMEYMIFFTFKLMETYKIHMYTQIVYIIVIIHWTFNLKVYLNTILTNQFQIYLLPTFNILKLILYSTYQKLNLGLNGFILILTPKKNLFFMFMSKFWFWENDFLVYFTIFCPI